MTYHIRTSDGVLKAKVTDRDAFKIASQCKGHQKTMKFKGIGTIGCFVLDGDYSFVIGDVTIVLLEGDYVHFVKEK